MAANHSKKAADINAQCLELRHQNVLLKQQHAAAIQANEALEKELRNALESTQDSASIVQKVTKDSQALSSEKDVLAIQNQELSLQVNAHENDVKEMLQKLKALESTCDTLTQELLESKARVKSLENAKSSLADELEGTQQARVKHEALASQSAHQVTSLEEQLHSVSDALATLSAASNGEAHRTLYLEEQNKLLLKEKSELQVGAAQHSLTIHSLLAID